MPEISVGRGLVILKGLDDRITKSISNFTPLEILIGGKLKCSKTVDEFVEAVKSDYQSIHGLLKYKNTVKSAIVKSNADTFVKINQVNMTVAEAIERKRSIVKEKHLLQHMRQELKKFRQAVEIANVSAQTRLDQLVAQTLSKESTKIKGDEYESIAKPFMTRNESRLIDPLDLETQVNFLENSIDKFEEEVDICLSESNARTMINI
jgi:hypothetical protein